MNKPTIIRGVKLEPGSQVFLVYSGTYPMIEGADVRTFTIKATNGTTFALARKTLKRDAAHGPWAWSENPERFCVSQAEVDVEVEFKKVERIENLRKLRDKTYDEIEAANRRVIEINSKILELSESDSVEVTA